MQADGKVAVVTGAGTGIGRGVALRLLSEGYRVALLGRRRQQIEETAQLSPGKSAALVIPTDVVDRAMVDDAFRRTVEAFGRVDLLFNNAGVFGKGSPFEDISVSDWNDSIGVNLTGAFLCAQAAYRCMKAQSPQGGRIINNGSISAHVPRPNASPYTVAKHGISGLTKAIALEGRRHNIACGQIDIGNAATDMTDQMERGMLQADGTVRSEATISVKSVVDAVALMASLPLNANVLTMTVIATAMPYVGRG